MLSYTITIIIIIVISLLQIRQRSLFSWNWWSEFKTGNTLQSDLWTVWDQIYMLSVSGIWGGWLLLLQQQEIYSSIPLLALIRRFTNLMKLYIPTLNLSQIKLNLEIRIVKHEFVVDFKWVMPPSFGNSCYRAAGPQLIEPAGRWG